jgi:vacuolar protein 8
MVDAVAIAGHVRALAHGDAAAKSRAAWEVWRLMEGQAGRARSEEHVNWITRAGAIPPLVELLQSGGYGALCAAGALAYLAYDQDNKVAIAAAGGIAPLVEVVRSGCGDSGYLSSKCNAAVALANLARNDDNRVAIAAAGAIAPLVDLLRDGRGGTKKSVAHALKNLAYRNADNKVAIAAAGAIAPLVALTRSDHSKGAEQAEAALKSLAHDNVDNQVLIAEAKGDIKTLVALARSGSYSASSDAAKNAAARFLARRRRSIVNRCVDGKVPAELEPLIAACLARRGFS